MFNFFYVVSVATASCYCSVYSSPLQVDTAVYDHLILLPLRVDTAVCLINGLAVGSKCCNPKLASMIRYLNVTSSPDSLTNVCAVEHQDLDIHMCADLGVDTHFGCSESYNVGTS